MKNPKRENALIEAFTAAEKERMINVIRDHIEK